MEGSLVSVTGLESRWTLRHLVCPAVPIPAPQMGSCSTHSHLCCCAQNSSSTCWGPFGDLGAACPQNFRCPLPFLPLCPLQVLLLPGSTALGGLAAPISISKSTDYVVT